MSREYFAALVFVPVVTGSISFVSSSLMVYMILSNRKRSMTHVKQRLLLALSCSDLCFSSAATMSTFPAPKDPIETDTDRIFNEFYLKGTVGWCDFQGFLFQVGIATPMYNACLCLYYFLAIWCGKSDRDILRCIEPTMHVVVLTFAIVSATIPLTMGLYNFDGALGCFIGDPPKCEVNPHVCHRGEGVDFILVAILVGGIPLALSFATVCVCMSLIYCKVRRTEWTKYRWRLRPDSSGQQRSSGASSIVRQSDHQHSSSRPPKSESNASALCRLSETEKGEVMDAIYLTNPEEEEEEDDDDDNSSSPSSAEEEKHEMEEYAEISADFNAATNSDFPGHSPLAPGNSADQEEEEYEQQESSHRQSSSISYASQQSTNSGSQQHCHHPLQHVRRKELERPTRNSLFGQDSSYRSSMDEQHQSSQSVTSDGRANHRYYDIFGNNNSSSLVLRSNTSSNNNNNKLLDEKKAKASRKGSSSVRDTGFLYVLSFLVTYLPAIVTIVSNSARWWRFALVTLLPLQGFWNLVIYLQPRMKVIKRRHGDLYFPQVLFMAIFRFEKNRPLR